MRRKGKSISTNTKVDTLENY